MKEEKEGGVVKGLLFHEEQVIETNLREQWIKLARSKTHNRKRTVMLEQGGDEISTSVLSLRFECARIVLRIEARG